MRSRPNDLTSRTAASDVRHAAILLAGGRSAEQRDGPDVAFLPLAGRRLVSRAVTSLAERTGVDHVAVCVYDSDRPTARAVMDREASGISYELVTAGLSTQQTLHHALEALAGRIEAGRCELVLVHDAAMPLVPPHLVRSVIAAARRWGYAVPYLGVDDYVWIDRMGAALRFSGGADRVQVQCPQAFRAVDLLHAYRQSAREGFLVGSATEAVERYCGRRVRGIPGDTRNVEIRTPHDIFAAEGLLATLHYVVT